MLFAPNAGKRRRDAFPTRPKALFLTFSALTGASSRPRQGPRHVPRHPPNPMNERGAKYADLYRYSGLGFQFAAVVGVFSLGGHWLDGRLGSRPWLLLVGVFAGFALGLYSLLSKLPGGTPARRRDEPPR